MARLTSNLLAIVTISVIIFWLMEPHEAFRLLDEDENFTKNTKFISINCIYLQALQKGTAPPPQPNGCSHVIGSNNHCKLNGQNFTGHRATALPPPLLRVRPQAMTPFGVAT
ncbi:hypothetical protein DCAR_0207739 [Daucus carota subsp. sativus]|uniref:Uncharacterized protein n=1 Tax=Daucus carota subsp. sativus TaxID=79200 RepID=A0AAF0WF65_DAUCS|nr:hypothetical protein DCAR_0207739 [Daucus carota subsp. sativus]